MAELTGSEVIVVIVFYAIIFLILLAIFLWIHRGIFIVRHTEVMVMERFGKYRNTLKPGLHFVIPFVDRPRSVTWRYLTVPHGGSKPVVKTVETERIDMREHCVDFGKQHVITKDNVQLIIDALVYYRITDPRLAVYNIQNLPDAIELLTQSTLRDIVAHLTLDDTFSSREQVNDELKGKTFTDAERWGASILRVEIFNISPPGDVKAAMESQIQEERQRRATVLQADGERESMVIESKGQAAKMVLEAEADRKAAIQRARGQSEAKLLSAQAEAKALALVTEAITDEGVRASDYLTAAKYLKKMQSTAGHWKRGAETKVVLVPTDIINGIGDIAKFNTMAATS